MVCLSESLKAALVWAENVEPNNVDLCNSRLRIALLPAHKRLKHTESEPEQRCISNTELDMFVKAKLPANTNYSTKGLFKPSTNG